jgi:hypothetical protein
MQFVLYCNMHFTIPIPIDSIILAVNQIRYIKYFI